MIFYKGDQNMSKTALEKGHLSQINTIDDKPLPIKISGDNPLITDATDLELVEISINKYLIVLNLEIFKSRSGLFHPALYLTTF